MPLRRVVAATGYCRDSWDDDCGCSWRRGALNGHGVAEALVAGCCRDRRDSPADGLQLHVATQPAFPRACRRRPGTRCRRWTPTQGPARRPAARLGRAARGRAGHSRHALEAYAYAARVAEVENPKCHIAWTTLAGIGHGREPPRHLRRSPVIAPNGDVRPPIRGVMLDGTMGNLTIPDTDGGRLDGDPVFDRAMGPMQFIPETWRLYGVDANNDGIVSPDNIDDAALSAAGYLCWRGQGSGASRGVGWTRCVPTTCPTSTPVPCATGRPPTRRDTPCRPRLPRRSHMATL